MAAYSLVDVTINRNTGALVEPTIGRTLVVVTGETPVAFGTYNDLAAVAEAGYATTSAAYLLARSYFGQSPSPSEISIISVEEDYVAAIDEALAQDSDFTFVLTNLPAAPSALHNTLAAECGARGLILVADIDIAEEPADTVLTESDNLIVFASQSYVSNAAKGNVSLAAAAIGRLAQYEPGSATWAFKSLSGIAAEDLTAAQVLALDAKHINTYIKIYGQSVTTLGQVYGGEWVDVILGIQWIRNQIKVRETSLIINDEKIPYTDTGIAQVVAVLDGILKEATARGIIRDVNGIGEYDISAPALSDISANDIANRKLKNVTWTAKLAGAIQHLEITGTVSY